MKLFYFSGTGNSFYVGKKIADSIKDIEIISISESLNKRKLLNDKEDVVVISPVYFYGLPNIVKSFFESNDFNNIGYLSIIFTAEFPNGLAINSVKQICKDKKITINSVFYLKMPTNYLLKSKMLNSKQIDKSINDADRKINKIIEVIHHKKNKKEKDSFLYSIITSANKYYENWQKDFGKFDNKFSCNNKCTGCLICVKNCPVENISMNKKIEWNGKCEGCLKCINICPVQSIQYNSMTEDKIRYFNPRVKLSEFK